MLRRRSFMAAKPSSSRKSWRSPVEGSKAGPEECLVEGVKVVVRAIMQNSLSRPCESFFQLLDGLFNPAPTLIFLYIRRDVVFKQNPETNNRILAIPPPTNTTRRTRIIRETGPILSPDTHIAAAHHCIIRITSIPRGLPELQTDRIDLMLVLVRSEAMRCKLEHVTHYVIQTPWIRILRIRVHVAIESMRPNPPA